MIKDKSELIELVENMPAFPNSVHKVMELTSDINCDAKALAAVIEHDPIMTMKLLKLVNSPFFGLRREVTSVNSAIVYVGLNTIKNIALSIATVGVLPKKNKAGLDMDAFLKHSLATGAIARLLAKKMDVKGAELSNYFISGLLHDIGKIVFAQFLPDDFSEALHLAREKKITLHHAEKKIIGVDHTVIGTLLGKGWKLPENLIDSIKDHHNSEIGTQELPLLHDFIFLANQICKELNIGSSGELIVETVPENIKASFGKEVPEIIESLVDLNEELEKAFVFSSV